MKLLDNYDIQLNKGVRYGLVGLNGCGKTTLLRRTRVCHDMILLDFQNI